MEARKLRLGNYLEDRNGKLCRVAELCGGEERQIYAPAIEGGITSLPNKPIPLSEEWLLKMGFIKDNGRHGDYYYHNKQELFRAWQSLDEVWCIGRKDPTSTGKGYNTHWIKIGVESVSEMQNLFYFLTNEELTLNQ